MKLKLLINLKKQSEITKSVKIRPPIKQKITINVNFKRKSLKMNDMKKLMLFAALVVLTVSVQAQTSEKKSKKEIKAEKKAQQIAETKMLVDSKSFVFDASTANPMKGRTVNLSTDYQLTIKNDSVNSYLPYYGVAYSGAAYGGGDSPMVFKQPLESYSSEVTKKGYMVKFKAKNGNDVIDGTLHVSETGSTSLSVSSMNRQSITYFGNLTKIEEEKK